MVRRLRVVQASRIMRESILGVNGKRRGYPARTVGR
jgi:hypothetical protein